MQAATSYTIQYTKTTANLTLNLFTFNETLPDQ